MNIIKFLTLSLLFVFQTNIYGQGLLTREQEREIKTSGKYYFNEYSALGATEAKEGAIQGLTQKVIMELKSQTLNADEAMIKNALETRAQTSVLSQTGRVIILAWIEKANVLQNPASAASGITSTQENEIKNSGRYYYSECSDLNETEAKECAVNDLIQKVIVDMVHQKITSDETILRDAVEMRVETAILSQAERVIILAWVEKESVLPKVTQSQTAVEEAKKIAPSEAIQTSPVLEPVFIFRSATSEAIRDRMEQNVKAVFSQINRTYSTNKEQAGLNISKVNNNATDEAIERIQALWSTSPFFCTLSKIEEPVLKAAKGWQVRNIPVFFEKGDSKEDQYQSIVIEFTENGVISDMYIALAMHQYYTIIQAKDTVTDARHRLMLLEFVENFRTAYNRRDINFLKQVFSNDALIIVGKEVQQKGDSKKPFVEYKIKSKEEYINDLKIVFDRNSFVSVKFDEIEVMKEDYLYGVTLKQTWSSKPTATSSQGYSDEGWLFLAIDYRDETNPQIWVRTWQPLSVQSNEKYGLGSFDWDF